MAYNFNGTSEYLSAAVGLLSDEPITMAAWFKSSTTGVSQNIISLGNNGTNGYWRISIDSDNTIGARKQASGGASSGANSSTTFSTGVWQHAAGTFTDNSNRAAHLNGTNKGTSTTNVADTSADFTNIGALVRSSASDYFPGDIADAAIWNVVLSDAEIAILADGVSPLFVRPESLVMYTPLIAGIQDYVGGVTLSATGSPSKSAHPRIIYPTTPFAMQTIGAAAGGATGKANPLMGPLGGPLAGIL